MKYYAQVGDREWVFEFERSGDVVIVNDGSSQRQVDLSVVGDGAFSLIVDGESVDCLIDREQGKSVVQIRGERIIVEAQDERERAASEVASAKAGGKSLVEAAMPGVVVELSVAVGDKVEEGQTLLVLEAMKMQNPIKAEVTGVVTQIDCEAGQAVPAGAILAEIDGDAE